MFNLNLKGIWITIEILTNLPLYTIFKKTIEKTKRLLYY